MNAFRAVIGIKSACIGIVDTSVFFLKAVDTLENENIVAAVIAIKVRLVGFEQRIINAVFGKLEVVEHCFGANDLNRRGKNTVCINACLVKRVTARKLIDIIIAVFGPCNNEFSVFAADDRVHFEIAVFLGVDRYIIAEACGLAVKHGCIKVEAFKHFACFGALGELGGCLLPCDICISAVGINGGHIVISAVFVYCLGSAPFGSVIVRIHERAHILLRFGAVVVYPNEKHIAVIEAYKVGRRKRIGVILNEIRADEADRRAP